LDRSYLVNTPFPLKVKNEKTAKKIIDEIMKAIKEKKNNINIDKIGSFKIEKYTSKDKSILFVHIDSKSINPTETIHQNIWNKIKKANKQLGAFKHETEKKILLLSNHYTFANSIKYLIEALSFSYKELLKLKNIDEIWLQLERQEDNPILVYERNFLVSFDEKNIKTDKQSLDLFERWFSVLERLGDEHKEKLFVALKDILSDKGKKPYQIFDNPFVREKMVQLGIWLAEKKRFDKVVWIIDKFIDDPNPEDPEKYFGDPKFNYHQQIIDGKDIGITTVLGHLAWVVQKLAMQKNILIKL